MLSHHDLETFLQQGGVVLLPNHHGAAQWQDQHGRWRAAAQHTTVVHTPAIFAIDLWLNQLWQSFALQCNDALLSWRVLNAGEEELLWQQLLAQSPLGATLLNSSGTARQLREAMALLQLWQLNPADIRRYLQMVDAVAEVVDDRILAWQWLQQFQQRCQREQWLTGSGLLPALMRVLNANPAACQALLPRKLLWLGFDDSPPLYQALQQTLQQLGVAIEHASLDIHRPTAHVQAWEDTAAECRAAARWAQNILQHTPSAQIGIICPQLHSLRPQLLRIFSQHLPVTDLYCSATTTLAEQPFFHTALQLLTITENSIESIVLCQLLRSPFVVGSQEEIDQRAALEIHLRKQGELEVATAHVRELVASAGKPWHCPSLAKTLIELQTHQRRFRKPQKLCDWLEVFQHYWQLLLALPQLAQPQHSLLQLSWQQWLDQLQFSSSLFGNISRDHAISILKTLAQSSRLANRHNNAAVRLLTPVETAAVDFSHLWVMQLQLGSWPAEPRPNPCLPLRLQRDLQMPSVDAVQELNYARHQLQRWLSHTRTEVVLSYAMQVDDLRSDPSPLLADLPAATTNALPVPAALHTRFADFPRNALVLSNAPQHLPLPTTASREGPGGLLTAQSACPFQAFAKHRLYASELPAFNYGLSARAVGELLHTTMQEFWQVIGASTALTSDADTVAIRLDTAITNALRKLAHKYPFTVTLRFQQLEHQRLLELFTRWLEVEKQRRPFTVTMTEQPMQWTWQSLRLNLRVDRVDQSENGALVIDYKSGNVASIDWLDERPTQPQLLLYQQALSVPVTGVLYAKLSLEKLDYAGITAGNEGFDNLVFTPQEASINNWQALQQHWQRVLQALAQEYLDGLVVVSPRSSQSCRYCHLPALCRINELRQQPEGQQAVAP